MSNHKSPKDPTPAPVKMYRCGNCDGMREIDSHGDCRSCGAFIQDESKAFAISDETGVPCIKRVAIKLGGAIKTASIYPKDGGRATTGPQTEGEVVLEIEAVTMPKKLSEMIEKFVGLEFLDVACGDVEKWSTVRLLKGIIS